MFSFFCRSTPTRNPSPIQLDNTSYNLLFLMLSMLPIASAQHGGGGHGGGGHVGGYGGGYVGGHGYSGGGAGECDVACATFFRVAGGIFGLGIFVCLLLVMCTGSENQADNSLTSDCPFDNPRHWLTSTDIAIPVSISRDIIEFLKSNPGTLNNLWDGIYSERGQSGRFNPELVFSWNEEKNLMEFKSIGVEQDDYGHYKIINGMFSFENGRFVAHKEYYNPSQQSVPYTIVQAGNIDFATKNEQICLTVSGSWYSTYNNSVQGTFEYNKTIPELTIANKCESYGTFGNHPGF